MTYRLKLELKLGTASGTIHGAVELDNDNFISSRVSGDSILASAESESLMSLLRTADDFISCVQVAERATRKTFHP